jgi:hypothetical protein
MAFRKAADAGAACDGYSTKRGNFAADSLQVQQSVFCCEIKSWVEAKIELDWGLSLGVRPLRHRGKSGDDL